MTVKLSEFGAAIVQLFAPDKNGVFSDVVCGYDDLASYEFGDGAQGAVVGRWANRIAKGKFNLDGKEYSLLINNGENHLHGGKNNFIKALWSSEAVDADEPMVIFTHFSPDGEEGYPGNMSVTVTYTLTNDNALSINYKATTDKKTVINLTNHSYFNMGGYASGSVRDQILWVDADTFLETDEGLIPTGRMLKVKDTPFDFTEPKAIGRDIDTFYRPLQLANGGYDHCFNFTGGESRELVLRASLYCSKTGREMQVFTNKPCVQVYTSNFMKNLKFPFKGGLPQRRQHAVCLETQRMPDSMNHEGFTNCILNPGETYDYTTIYKFTVKQ
jgi:aldose 1-epimerase